MYRTLPNDDGEWNHAWAGHDIIDVEAVFDFNSDNEPSLYSLTFFDSDGHSLRMHNFNKRVLAQFEDWFGTLTRSELNELRDEAHEEALGEMVEAAIDYAKESRDE